MIFKKRLMQVKQFLFAPHFVLTPAKTGSTYVRNALGLSVHAHSFLFDTVYFYRNVRGRAVRRLLNRYLFATLMLLRAVLNFFGGRKFYIYVPVRDLNSRNESLLRDIFFPLVARIHNSQAYRSIRTSSKREVMDFLRGEIQPNAYDSWSYDHGLRKEDIELVLVKGGARERMHFGSIKFIIFDVASSEKVLTSLLGARMGSFRDGSKNSSAGLWYCDLFNEE